MWEMLLITSTIVLFVLPLVPALQEWRRKRDMVPLGINPADKVHTNFLARSFGKQVEKEIISFAPELEQDFGENPYPTLLSEGVGSRLEALMRYWSETRHFFAEGPVSLPDSYTPDCNVYVKKDVYCGANNRLMGVLTQGDLELGRNSSVLRWAHARTVRVDKEGLLAGRVSAEERIVLQTGCRFGRLHAPTVTFSPLTKKDRHSRAGTRYYKPPSPSIQVDFERWVVDRQLVDRDLDFPTQKIFRGDIIVRGDVTIRSGSKIVGSIKCCGNMRIEQGAMVKGSLIARKSVVIGSNCRIGGPVVAENDIEVGPGSRIGSARIPTSVAAPFIRVMENVSVHGTVWAGKEGKVTANQEEP